MPFFTTPYRRSVSVRFPPIAGPLFFDKAEVMTTRPNQSRLLIWSAVALAVFIAGCSVIFWWSEWVSQSEVASYLLIGITALSALAAPVLLGRAAFTAFVDKVGHSSRFR